MKKLFLLILPVIFSLSLFSLPAKAYHSKNQKPTICIPEDERTKAQINHQKRLNKWMHRLSKLQQDCAILKIAKQKKTIESIGDDALCPSVPFNHRSAKKSKLFLKPDSKSKVLENIKKGQEMLFISEANKNWSYVSVRIDKSCKDGFLEAKNLVTKDGEDKVISVGSNLISIIEPAWKIKNKLITIAAEGSLSIIGAVQEGKIDQIIINEEEENLQSDNSFSFLIFVPKSGVEVRIIGNKKGKKVKELIFKVNVGN